MADAFFTSFLARMLITVESVESLCISSPNTREHAEFGNTAPSILCLAVSPLTFLVDSFRACCFLPVSCSQFVIRNSGKPGVCSWLCPCCVKWDIQQVVYLLLSSLSIRILIQSNRNCVLIRKMYNNADVPNCCNRENL